jgi:hypothetical protein
MQSADLLLALRKLNLEFFSLHSRLLFGMHQIVCFALTLSLNGFHAAKFSGEVCELLLGVILLLHRAKQDR